MRGLMMLATILFLPALYAQEKHCPNCNSRVSIFETLNEKKLIESIDLKSITIGEFELLLAPEQYLNTDVLLDEIYGKFNFYFMRDLENGCYLKIYPQFPNDFSYDYIQMEDEDVYKLVREMYVKCVYLYKDRTCITDELTFIKENDKTKLKF